MSAHLINASGVLSDPLYRQDFTYHNSDGEYDPDSGLWSETEGSIVNAYGSIQPVIRTELHELLEMLGGGVRIKSAILIFTTFDLIAAKNGDINGKGSVVQYDGLDWKVVDIQDYSPHGHKEVIAVRIDGQN